MKSERQSKRNHVFRDYSINLILILFSCFLSSCSQHNNLQNGINKQILATKNYRDHYQNKGILSASDHARLISIGAYVENKQQLSDEDLDFWVHLLNKGPIVDTPSNRYQFYSIVIGNLEGRKRLSIPEQRKLYSAILPYIYSAKYANATIPGKTDLTNQLQIGARQIAMQILASSHDPRTLTVLNDFASTSSVPVLKAEAKSLHQQLEIILKTKNEQ